MKKILAIEDEPIILKILQLRLSQEGIEFLVATSSTEGLSKVKEELPDLVLLDLLLPEISGIEILKTIKRDPKTKHIPVIVYTNVRDEAVLKQTKEAGAAECVIKGTISLEELVRRIKAVLRKPPAQTVPAG